MDELIKVRCPECGRFLLEAYNTSIFIIKCYKCSKKIKVEINDNKIEIKNLVNAKKMNK